MLIYRLESKTNLAAQTDKVHAGFYRSADDWQVMLFTDGYYDEDNFLHPLPEHDSLLQPAWVSLTCEEARHWYFGFSTYQQMKRWFYDDWALAQCTDNIVLRIYECAEVHAGYTQAIFNTAAYVQCIAELPCTASYDDCMNVLM